MVNDSYECIKLEISENGIAVITISRPQVLNALNIETLHELYHGLDRLEEGRDIRGLIITGEGRAFVSGADLSEITQPRQGQSEFYGERFMDHLDLVEATFQKLEQFPRPTVAAVNGYALGGGFELALCCDFRVASEKSVFGFPEAGIGLSPAFGGTQRLPRLIGAPRAKELMFSGRKVHCSEALSLGLVEYTVKPEQLLQKATELLDSFRSNGPIAVKYIKKCIDRGLEMPLSEALQYEKSLGALCHLSSDGAEGIRSFMEKRAPVFENK